MSKDLDIITVVDAQAPNRRIAARFNYFKQFTPQARLLEAVKFSGNLVRSPYAALGLKRPDRETLHEYLHTAKLLARKLAPQGVDGDKAGLMALCHNLPEVAVWDLSPDPKRSAQEDQQISSMAADMIFEGYSTHYEAWLHHHTSESDEAKWSRDCAKLTAPLHVLAIEPRYLGQAEPLSRIFQSVAGSFETAQGESVYDQLRFSQDVQRRRGHSLGEGFLKFNGSATTSYAAMDIKRAEIDRIRHVL